MSTTSRTTRCSAVWLPASRSRHPMSNCRDGNRRRPLWRASERIPDEGERQVRLISGFFAGPFSLVMYSALNLLGSPHRK